MNSKFSKPLNIRSPFMFAFKVIIVPHNYVTVVLRFHSIIQSRFCFLPTELFANVNYIFYAAVAIKRK